MTSILPPKRPLIGRWQQQQKPPAWISMGYEAESWLHPETGIFVISAVEVAHEKDGSTKGPEYHLSISCRGGRCDTNDAEEVLRMFDMIGAEEDNHAPHGIVRNFWRPVAENLIGSECVCKADEPAIKENKGDYIWRGIT